MRDFLKRELFELKSTGLPVGSPVICEMGDVFEVAYSAEYLSRNGSYLEAHRVVDQFLQEVRDNNLEQYLPLVELLREGINELQESQRILEVTTQ